MKDIMKGEIMASMTDKILTLGHLYGLKDEEIDLLISMREKVDPAWSFTSAPQSDMDPLHWHADEYGVS